MRTRILALLAAISAVAAIVLVAAPGAAARLVPARLGSTTAAAFDCGAQQFDMDNKVSGISYTALYAGDANHVHLSATAQNDVLCVTPGSGSGRWIEDQFTFLCYSSQSDESIIERTCQNVPSEAWDLIAEPSGGTNFRDHYLGKCLAGNSDGARLYMYACGDFTPRDWYGNLS